MIDAVPENVPGVAGEKVTVKVALCPIPSASGIAGPLMLNTGETDTVAEETVTEALPVLVTVNVCERLPATNRFPKLMLEGLTVSVPLTVPWPIPWSGTRAGKFV